MRAWLFTHILLSCDQIRWSFVRCGVSRAFRRLCDCENILNAILTFTCAYDKRWKFPPATVSPERNDIVKKGTRQIVLRWRDARQSKPQHGAIWMNISAYRMCTMALNRSSKSFVYCEQNSFPFSVGFSHESQPNSCFFFSYCRPWPRSAHERRTFVVESFSSADKFNNEKK